MLPHWVKKPFGGGTNSSKANDSRPPALSDQIRNSFEHSKFPVDTESKPFLPRGELQRLITADAVARELKIMAISLPADRDLISFIRGSAQMIFASAIFATHSGKSLRKSMSRFKALNFSDKKLPVTRNDFNQLINDDKALTKLWANTVERELFVKEQWIFLAPVFPNPVNLTKETMSIVFRKEHIFPFTFVDDKRRAGTFGVVYQVTIHPSHQEFIMKKADGSYANAAIKELKASISEDEVEDQGYKEWNTEAEALAKLSHLRHRHMIQVRAIITRERKHYFMFQWADGGCLRDFYLHHKRPSLNSNFIKEVVVQLRGLADALDALHNFNKGGESYRHGDLKPENILIFQEGEVGLWKIADMGLAKHHFDATVVRGEQQTSTRYGTQSYEPPEVIQIGNNRVGARSRLYDIWSMGCITLELVTWLLYGSEWLREFDQSRKVGNTNVGPYWEPKGDGDTQIAKIHSKVIFCMEYMAEKDPECATTEPTAIKDLLRLVKTKLLVVALPVNSSTFVSSAVATPIQLVPSLGPTINVTEENHQTRPAPDPTPGPRRTTALSFCSELDKILQKGNENDKYWFSGANRVNVTGPPMLGSRLLAAPRGQAPPVVRIRERAMQDISAGLHAPSGRPDDHLNKFWDFPVDNKFADALFSRSKTFEAPSKPAKIVKLCGRCLKWDFWSDGFRIMDTLSELERQSPTCDFCKMRWDLCKHLDPFKTSIVRFDRLDSQLRMNESYPPVLSICRAPDSKAPIPLRRLQVGLPVLPNVGSNAHFAILQKWLEDCDAVHLDCQPLSTFCLPTRLVEVGSKNSLTVKLYKTQPKDNMKYFALSHPWGKPPPEPFCTYTSNVEQHHRGINVSDLPTTFQHAVTVTRALGLQYIWIDSLCIIQGPDGDFNEESKHMEDIYSKAYCVLAASSATSPGDGFLNVRKDRNFLTFKREGLPPVYVCKFIDDFNQHVLKGPLNKRGWVLQERVLARRTIYFTETQTYWECGHGVRCETLTKTENKLASFLGDSSFPKVAIESSHGGKIRLYQDLYMQYSRLAFTRQSDRPVAISGLEKRLIQSFGVHGGLGVFDDDGLGMFRRSLLWHRGEDEKILQKINFGASPLPTWSWMAHCGGIDYLDPPFGKITWEGDDIRSPWAPDAVGEWYSSDEARVLQLNAVARDFNIIAAEGHADAKIVYDVPGKTVLSGGGDVKCVVLGSSKSIGSSNRQLDNQRHWILIVFLTTSQGASNSQICRRLGVGYLPRKMISFGQKGTPVKIR